jgi:hypothetical protein
MRWKHLSALRHGRYCLFNQGDAADDKYLRYSAVALAQHLYAEISSFTILAFINPDWWWRYYVCPHQRISNRFCLALRPPRWMYRELPGYWPPEGDSDQTPCNWPDCFRSACEWSICKGSRCTCRFRSRGLSFVQCRTRCSIDPRRQTPGMSITAVTKT